MKVTFFQQIQLQNSPLLPVDVHKTIKTKIIPHKGDFLSDPAFVDPPYEFEVNRLVINYDEDRCYVYLCPYIIKSGNEQDLKNHLIKIKNYNWEH